MQWASYLVCKEYIEEVTNFLTQFFERVEDGYTHHDWVTFKIPDTDFVVNLMTGNDQDLTQNMTFEIYYDSLESLQEFAKKYTVQIESFVATKAATKYTYHFCEVIGPKGICKIEASYAENLK